jgi:hypothetical protein
MEQELIKASKRKDGNLEEVKRLLRDYPSIDINYQDWVKSFILMLMLMMSI